MLRPESVQKQVREIPLARALLSSDAEHVPANGISVMIFSPSIRPSLNIKDILWILLYFMFLSALLLYSFFVL